MKVPFLQVDGVEFGLIDGRDPPILQAACQKGRWSAEIRFWKSKEAMIVRVVPHDSALPAKLSAEICNEVDRKRDKLLDASKPV